MREICTSGSRRGKVDVMRGLRLKRQSNHYISFPTLPDLRDSAYHQGPNQHCAGTQKDLQNILFNALCLHEILDILLSAVFYGPQKIQYSKYQKECNHE
jgi:hypothetical protein